MAPRKKRAPGTFGAVEKLPSGRYRARYRGPDGRRYSAPTLFLSQRDARGWLALQQAEIIKGAWLPPGAEAKPQPRLSLAEYAEQWLALRDLKDRTREHYRSLLDRLILPHLGSLPLASITADDVRAWHAKLGEHGTPTLRAHAYGLLRTILGCAVSDGKLATNPCVIRGAGTARRVKRIRPATLEELETLTAQMPEHQRLMVLLSSWCALRFGELTELRRKDIDLKNGVVRVERAVVRTEGGFQVTTPKSDAGIRDVAIPPHLLPAVEDHLDRFVDDDPESLLFPARQGGHLAPASLYRSFYPAREAAGRPDLRWHDLRHSGAVLAAATGATLAELMARLGHSSPQAAMRYQHAARGRDKKIAELLSRIAENKRGVS